MKKLILCAAAAAVCLSANAQFTLDLGVVGRIDSNPVVTFGEGGGTSVSHNFGNSVVYTSVEAGFGEHVSFTWIAHWAETGAADKPFWNTPGLYKLDDGTPNIWRCDGNNFTDFLYFDFKSGGATLRLGKDVVALGGFEYDPYDWDCTYDMCSLLWLTNPAYQWGGSLILGNEDETTQFTLQAVSSPFAYSSKDATNSGKPWLGGMGQYAIKYYGCYGGFETSNSINFVQTTGFGNNYEDFSGVGSFTFGFKGNIAEKFSISGEWMNRVNTTTPLNKAEDFFTQGYRVLGGMDINPIDQFGISLRGGYEHVGVPEDLAVLLANEYVDNVLAPMNYWFAGATFNYWPLRDSKDLKISATFAGNSLLGKGFSSTIGITYNHVFHVAK